MASAVIRLRATRFVIRSVDEEDDGLVYDDRVAHGAFVVVPAGEAEHFAHKIETIVWENIGRSGIADLKVAIHHYKSDSVLLFMIDGEERKFVFDRIIESLRKFDCSIYQPAQFRRADPDVFEVLLEHRLEMPVIEHHRQAG